MTESPESGNSTRLAQRLRGVLHDMPEGGLSARQLVARLGADATWLALLLLGAAALVPSPGIPLGIVSGTAIALMAVQLLAGSRDLPPVIARRRVPHRPLALVIPYLVPWVERAESTLRPRLAALSAPATAPLWGLAILVQGIIIALPVPLGNTLPGLAVAVLALGLMRRDGLALLAGLVCCALGTGWAVGVVVLGAELAGMIFT